MALIASPHNPAIKRLRALSEKKHRQAEGLFLAEGDHVLARARLCGWEPETVVTTGAAESWGKATLLQVSAEAMAKLSAQNNPPLRLAAFRQRWLAKVEPEGLWLALEDIRDPGNLGTIIRTADAAGAAGVILAGQCCDPWGPDCVRATMGSIFAVGLARLSTEALAKLCREWPGEAVGTHLRGPADYRRPYRAPTLIVMGGEAHGLSEAVAEACATLVRIPMRDGVESLNVAIAAALMLFEARRTDP